MNISHLLVISLIVFSSNINAQFFPRFKNIKSIDLEIEENANINKEVPFVFTVYATTQKNKKKKINSMPNLKVWGENFIILGKNKIKILKSNDCDLREITIHYSVTKKDQVLSKSKVVKLNFKGNLTCTFNGLNGGSGSNGADGAFKGVVFRDGADGENGTTGGQGGNGHFVKAFVVKDSITDLIKLTIFDSTAGKTYCYFTTSSSIITIEANGGHGGRGGNGANGKDGKHGKVSSKGKNKRAGKGGNGGRGGDGGKGGNGGEIIVYIHKSAKEFKKNIQTSTNGGNGGTAGKPGNGGKPGIPLEGETKPRAGDKGSKGNIGRRGEQGFPTKYEIVEDYDFILYKIH